MERRYTGNDRIQLPEPKIMDTRKYTRQKTTTGQNYSKGYHNSTERTPRTTMQKKKAAKPEDRYTMETN